MHNQPPPSTIRSDTVAANFTWMLLWPTLKESPTPTERAHFTAFHTLHHGTAPTAADRKEFRDVSIHPNQLQHYANEAETWKREMTLMAWCGGVYDNTHLYMRVQTGSALACSYSRKEMLRWLPKVVVGATFRKSYRYGGSFVCRTVSYKRRTTVL